MLLWIAPAIIGLGPFIGWLHYVYNPDIFVCEQKWDKQTTFPFLIISFLVPLGVIFFLNYKVLKVVGQLQRSVKNFQPDKMQDHQNQQQFVNEDQDTNGSKRNQQQQNEQIKGLGMASTKPPTTNRNEIQCNCYENSAACYEEAAEMPEVIRQEDFAGEGGGIENVLKYQSFGLANTLNNRS